MSSSNSAVSKPIAPIISSEIRKAFSLQCAARIGERDGDRALVLDPPVAGDQAGGGQPLQERGERAAVEGEPGAELPTVWWSDSQSSIMTRNCG